MTHIKSRLSDCLGLTIPIFQGPMAGAVTPELISAVANSGGLGVIPLAKWPIENCVKIIDDTLCLTDKVVGANLILAWDQEERLNLCLEKGIKIIWFFWGDPSPYVDKIHKHGGKVILTVGSSKEAKKAVDSGVDLIVTQGWEAGGHVWGKVATFPLVPAVVDAIDGKVPVVAAGGIADGRGLAAAMTLGADGVVLGTRLLSSHEACIHEQFKNRIIKASESDTVYTDLFDKGWPGAPMRVLRNSTYDNWMNAGCPPPGQRPGEHDVITQYNPETPVERYSYNMPATVMEGDLEPLAHYAGQSVGLVKKRLPISEIVDEIIKDAVQYIKVCQSLIE